MSKEKVTLSANEITDKWSRRIKGAIPDIQRGIDAVTVSPTSKAADKKDKYLQGINNSVGKWEKGLRGVSLEEWKSKTKSKVSARMASGVDNAMDKHRKFAEYSISAVNAGLSKIKGMPDLTLDDNLNKAVAFMRHMAENPYKKG